MIITTGLRGFVNGPLCKNSVLPFGGGVGYTTELLQLGMPFNNCYYNILLIY